MPPNKQGGKNYKKGKHIDDQPIIYERLEDQMYGRVLKLLGGCNVLVYCNDNRERICHIRGNMRKKVWISVGDIVLISIRDLDKSKNSTNDIERGDICAKYDQKVIYRLKEKDNTINDKLFINIEKNECSGHKNNNLIGDDNTGFIFEENDNTIHSEDSDDNIVKSNFISTNRLAQKKAMLLDDEFNIDDI
jgi:translation initiation factor 1A